jgi:RNA polymerase sporulation-specific sigma factor
MEELVKKSREGDSAAALSLLEDFTPFIISTARKLYIVNHDLEDLIQIGRVSFLCALRKYDTDREFCFPAYAVNAVKNNYHHLIRKAADRNYEPDSSALDGLPSRTDIEEEFLENETTARLMQSLEKLPAEDRALIEWFYFRSGSIKAYAESNSLTYNSVVKKKQRILNRLRNLMTPEENEKVPCKSRELGKTILRQYIEPD